MNKTITINISGIVFYIDENAYEKLSVYLKTIRSYFKNADGGDEIMSDIEARIAEIFNQRMGSSRQVVMPDDVEAMIAIMGNPEVFREEEEESASKSSAGRKSQADYQTFQRSKRIFRDPDERVIGGVCSGIGHYFDIDPLWIRLAFAIALFGFGTGFLFYIILWIAMPKAVTTAEKLEMKGEKVNISNIEKNIKEELNSVRRKFDEGYKGTYNGGSHKLKYYLQRGTDFLVSLIKRASVILARLIGALLIIFGIIILVSLLAAMFSGTGQVYWTNGIQDMQISMSDFLNKFFIDSNQIFWAKVAVILLMVLPVTLAVYHGIKLLFRIKMRSRVLGFVFSLLWVAGLFIAIWVVAGVAGEFDLRGIIKEKNTISIPASKQIHLKINGNYPEEMMDDRVEEEDEHQWGTHNRRHQMHWRIGPWNSSRLPVQINDNKDMRFYTPTLDIIKSSNDSMYLVIYRMASGSTKKNARALASRINYTYLHDSTSFSFNPYFEIPADDKWRNQRVKIILHLPVNSSVYLDPAMSDIIYDIKNVTNTYDGDMVGHTWLMTSSGLMCTDCPQEKNKKEKHKQRQNDFTVDEEETEI